MALGLLLLPVDLLLVGPETVTTSGPGETMATAWAALSISLHALVVLLIAALGAGLSALSGSAA